MGPTWGRKDPGGPHVGHVNLAIWDYNLEVLGRQQVQRCIDILTRLEAVNKIYLATVLIS